MEMKDLANAGQILVKIWSAMVIDQKAVVVEYTLMFDNLILYYIFLCYIRLKVFTGDYTFIIMR